MPAPVFRLAPSPNGKLHLGHAYSALLNSQLARTLGGKLLLRIEDIDLARSRPRFIAQIIDDLRWLGVEWHGPIRLQSEHFADYRATAKRLAAGGLLYKCFASRAEIEIAAGSSPARDPDGAVLYPGLWRGADPANTAGRATAGLPYAWRLDMARALATLSGPLDFSAFEDSGGLLLRSVPAFPEQWGDAVIVRKDTPASYHLAVVHDDALQGVTHVVRGADLEAATSLHRLLQTLLGLPAPIYCHHRLLPGPDGRKLSKSFNDISLEQLRRGGATPADIRRLTGLPEDG